MPELRDYQREAVAWLRTHDRGALFLDMGLGKTASVLTALEPRHLPAVVVAPKRVAEEVWPVERDKWRPDLSLTLVAGSPAQRAQLWTQRPDITVVAIQHLAEVPLNRFRTVILDELSLYKNRATKAWRGAAKLTKPAAHVWGMTGTPAPNGLMDLWAQLYLLDRGKRLGTSLGAYRARYFAPAQMISPHIVTSWRLLAGAEPKIWVAIEDICLSMSLDGRVALPPVTEHWLEFDLPRHAQKAYDDLERDMLTFLGGEAIVAANAAVVSGKLGQVTSGSVYTDTGDTVPLHDVKLDLLAEIVDGPHAGGVLVLYEYASERDRILERFPDARLINSPGVLADWDAGTVPILLTHPASVGHGLNLQTGGHTVVWTTGTWSLELWQQANRRLARSGQQHPVVIHLLVARRTVDVARRRRVETKQTTQQAMLDYLELKAT